VPMEQEEQGCPGREPAAEVTPAWCASALVGRALSLTFEQGWDSGRIC